MTLSFTNRYDLYKCVALKPTRANRLFNCFFVLYSDRFLPNLPLLLDLRKFFVSFPPLHIFVYYAGLFWHLINWRAKALFDKTVLISLRHHFFSLYIQSIKLLSHPLAQVLPNHTRNANAFFLRGVLSSFYLTVLLPHFKLEMCTIASCSKNWPSPLTLTHSQTLSSFLRAASFFEHVNSCLSEIIPNVFTRNHKGIVQHQS